MGKVLPFKFKKGQSNQAIMERANSQIERAFNLIALSRRRTSNPVDGKTVMVSFDTEMEANLFQSFIHALPKRRKPSK